MSLLNVSVFVILQSVVDGDRVYLIINSNKNSPTRYYVYILAIMTPKKKSAVQPH